MTHKKLLKNIWFAAKHHEELNRGISNDLLQEDYYRRYAKGSADAYSYIVQMITHYDTIGSTDYQKVFDMEDDLPYILDIKKQRKMESFREYLKNLKK